jgi:hypothetical protein
MVCAAGGACRPPAAPPRTATPQFSRRPRHRPPRRPAHRLTGRRVAAHGDH